MKHHGRQTIYEDSDYGVSRFDYDALHQRQLELSDNRAAKVEQVSVAPLSGHCNECGKDFTDIVLHKKECFSRK